MIIGLFSIIIACCVVAVVDPFHPTGTGTLYKKRASHGLFKSSRGPDDRCTTWVSMIKGTMIFPCRLRPLKTGSSDRIQTTFHFKTLLTDAVQ
jgi:hypothetical protein